MKVIYKNGKSAVDGWLNPGREYLVLYIQTFMDGRQKYLIWSDLQSCVAFFSVSEFEIIDRKIPPNWVVSTDLNDCLVIGPESWLEVGFWERFYDGDHSAEEIFNNEVEKMKGRRVDTF